MHTTNLRKVGGSVMLVIPPALLDVLHLAAGAKVGLAIDSGRLVVEPIARPHYSLDELLAQCDASAEITADDREWLDARPAGGELL
jgi:antitoxin ChpS